MGMTYKLILARNLLVLTGEVNPVLDQLHVMAELKSLASWLHEHTPQNQTLIPFVFVIHLGISRHHS